jgi:hypothetical protein
MVGRLFPSFGALFLAIVLSGGAASAAGTWTVQYKLFPDGSQGALPNPLVTKGKFTTIAKRTLPGPPKVTYEFLFWNVNGVSTTSNLTERKLSEPAPPAGKNNATAWYLATGGGGKCAPNCSVATWAFSENQNAVIANTTPVASVSPSSLWSTPSTSVSTETSSPSVTIMARASLGVSPKFSPLFQRWQELPKTKIAGSSLTVPADTSAEAIAFYRQLAAPPPNPCLGKPLPCRPF